MQSVDATYLFAGRPAAAILYKLFSATLQRDLIKRSTYVN